MRGTSLAAAVCALVMVAAPAQAQYGGMGGMGGTGGMRGGMGRGGGGRSGSRPMMMVTDDQLDGPPTPETMHQLLGLDESQLTEYAHRYEALMAETKVQRDSAHAALRTMRESFTAGDRDAARANGAQVHELADDLAKHDQAFDRSLKDLLTKEQQKSYDHWKDQNRKDAEEKQRDEMRGGGGGRGRRGGGGGSGGVPTF